jgi:hypothetical protein
MTSGPRLKNSWPTLVPTRKCRIKQCNNAVNIFFRNMYYVPGLGSEEEIV